MSESADNVEMVPVTGEEIESLVGAVDAQRAQPAPASTTESATGVTGVVIGEHSGEKVAVVEPGGENAQQQANNAPPTPSQLGAKQAVPITPPKSQVQANEGQPKTIRLPNVTLPCPSGVIVDATSHLPEGADASNATIDYVWGVSECKDGRVTIYPEVPGEQEVGLTYLLNGKRCSTIFKLLVNQDPKKLWVSIEPPSASPFMKDLYAKKSYKDDKVRFLAASRRGRSHEQSGTFRDDDFGFWSSPEGDVYLLVVADGAGSAKYSREGSRRAVQAAIDYLSQRLKADVWSDEELVENKDGKVAQMLVSAANSSLVQLDAFCKTENQKLNATEKYALKDFNTTLLLAAVKVTKEGARKIVSFSIGDGAIAWVEPGKSELLCAPDGGEYSGQTRFLTTTPVWAKAAADWAAFRSERVFTKTVAPADADSGFLALMTDGVSDPFFETDVKLHDAKIWDDFVLGEADVDEGAKSLKDVISEEVDTTAEGMLLNWLGFWSRGNHDDRTLAVLSSAQMTGEYARRSTAEEQPANGEEPRSAGIWDRCKHLLG